MAQDGYVEDYLFGEGDLYGPDPASSTVGWEPYVSTTYATAELSNFYHRSEHWYSAADEYFIERMLYVPV